MIFQYTQLESLAFIGVWPLIIAISQIYNFSYTCCYLYLGRHPGRTQGFWTWLDRLYSYFNIFADLLLKIRSESLRSFYRSKFTKERPKNWARRVIFFSFWSVLSAVFWQRWAPPQNWRRSPLNLIYDSALHKIKPTNFSHVRASLSVELLNCPGFILTDPISRPGWTQPARCRALTT